MKAHKCTETPTRVPAITDPLGRYWPQPPRDRVLLDGVHALVSRQGFAMLQDCTGRRPEPARAGMMWRANFRGKWWLMWYEPDVLTPETLAVQWRELLVAE